HREIYTPEQLREIPSYILTFGVPVLVDDCVFLDVRTRKDGSFTKELRWPDIVKHPNSWPLISYDRARSVAISHGFDGYSTRPVLKYDASADRFFYIFSSKAKGGTYKGYLIDALSGEFVKETVNSILY